MTGNFFILGLSILALVAGSLQIRTVDGRVFRPLEPAGLANVLLFVSTDCPVSNAYAPELQRICAAYAAKGIACSLIYEDPKVSASEVRKHLDEYRYRAVAAAIDTDGSVAAAVRATVTPQAVIVDRSGTVRYSGRIDNLYEALGRPRRVVTTHDLENALTAIAGGKAPAVTRTEAVGCYIVPSEQRRQANPVTFSETVAPIVYANCVTCHRPGEAAPFSLITYADVKKKGRLIAEVTESRYMPPWRAAHGYGEFADERRLTDAQIATLAEWVKQGMPEGDPRKMPALPKFPEGWHLGTPDLVLKMPAAYELPASGPDIYRNFVIPTGLTENKWVRAIEFRPGARKAVHHALFAYDTSGAAAKQDGRDGRPGFRGMGMAGVTGGGGGPLGGWAVGATPMFLPAGVALPLPKGSDLIIQMHFHLTGKPEIEQATVGIYFTDQAPERRLWAVQVPALFGFGAGIDIPPGEKHYVVEDSVTLPVDMKAIFVAAHAHYLAKEMKATATLPDGSTQPLLWIKDWDFNWQDRYQYKAPVMLPKGTRIDVRLVYDNSAGNPRHPDPSSPKRVLWGEQSFDEMGTVSVAMQALRAEDEPVLQRAIAARTQAAIGRGMANGTLKRYLDARGGGQR